MTKQSQHFETHENNIEQLLAKQSNEIAKQCEMMKQLYGLMAPKNNSNS